MKLGITVTADRMQALLSLPAGMALSRNDLDDRLRDQGVSFGIQEEALAEAQEESENDRQLILARGQAPVDARAGKLMPFPKVLPRWTEQGAELGQYTPAQRPVDGVGVNGHPVTARRLAQLQALDEDGLEVDEEGILRATRGGWFFLDEDGTWCIRKQGMALTLDEIDLTVAANRSRASLDVPAGRFIPLMVMRTAIQRAGIMHGLATDLLKQVSQAAMEERILVIARETPPQHGGDSKLDYLVAERPSFEPDEHGNLDFMNYSAIVQVDQGRPLASLGRASHGIDGCNILGEAIPARPGVQIDIARFKGDGAQVDPSDPTRLVAEFDGVFKVGHDGKVSVVQMVVIDGDVDLHSGSVDTDYAVVIKGDIKAGFRVKSGADIEVSGVIEDARVTAQGNLEVRGGILPGKQRVKAHGDIVARFARDRVLKCRDLMVHESLRNCWILATGNCSAKQIIGGDIKCHGDCVCEELGNKIEAECLIHVGVNPFKRSLFEEARNRHTELEAHIEQARERAKLTQVHLERLTRQHRLKPTTSLKNQINSVASEARRALREYQDQARELNACIHSMEQLGQEMYDDFETSRIIAGRSAWPGVTVRIGPTYYNTVLEELGKSTFAL